MDNGHRTERIGRVSMGMLTEDLTGLDAGLCSVGPCAFQTILSIALFAAHGISFFGYSFNHAFPGKPAQCFLHRCSCAQFVELFYGKWDAPPHAPQLTGHFL